MSERKTSYKQTIINALVFFVVIAGGIFAGFWISVKTGLTDGLAPGQEYAGENKTNIKEGKLFPAIAGEDVNYNEVAVQPLLTGKKTIVAFVSGTCEPCRKLSEELMTWPEVGSGEYQVILLTHDPDMFRGNPHFTVLKDNSELLDSLNIRMFPTICAVDPGGKVKMVASGFGANISRDLFANWFAKES